MQKLAVQISFVCFAALMSVSIDARHVVPVTVEEDIYHYVTNLAKGREIAEISDFTGSNMQRDVVDFIMIKKALKLGGIDIKFDMRKGNYDARNPRLLQSGDLLISLDSIWLSQANDLKDSVYISEPIIQKGHYWTGIFTSPDNKKALGIKTLDDFKRLSVVSSKAWSTDWLTLQDINPDKLIDDSDWLSMAKLVSRGWVDVMLVSFNKSKPFTYQGNGYHLVAVEGVKIQLKDSRHYCVSKKHPLGKATFAALQKGLAVLNQTDAIEKAYRQVGFYNPDVDDWKVLNGD